MPTLNEEEQVRLDSCMDEIRNVVGDTASERQLVETIMNCNYDCAQALDTILNLTTSQQSIQAPPSASALNKAPSTAATTKEPMETGKNCQKQSKFLEQICFNFGFSFSFSCAFCIPYVFVCRGCLCLHVKYLYFRYV